jgi:hypothetical protein
VPRKKKKEVFSTSYILLSVLIYYVMSLKNIYSSHHSLSNGLNFCSSLSVEYHVSYPSQTRGKIIIVLYI